MSSPDDLRGVLRAELVTAKKARRSEAVTTLRTAIATLENAEAIPAANRTPTAIAKHVIGASQGAGSTEVERRTLTTDDERRILTDLIAEFTTDADQLEELGRLDAASKLRNSATLLGMYAPDAAG